MVENFVSMPLVSRDQHWIGKEVLRVVFSCPRKILSDAAGGSKLRSRR